MGPLWTAKQFDAVVDRFRDECPTDAWDDILLRYAVLLEKGPVCGPMVAKKLVNAKGIWELLGHADNAQPRLLFYFSATVPKLIVFVHGFMKKGKNDYKTAIELAQRRRRSIEHAEKQANVITDESINVH